MTAIVLSGCGGEEAEQILQQLGSTTLQGDDSLAGHFIQSFDVYQSAANQLINVEQQYTSQELSWYFDNNGNGRRDDTERMNNTYPLQSSGIHYAHAAGLSGKGQTVAIIDDGFSLTHEALSNVNIQVPGYANTESHGTSVASVIAGQSDYMTGVAPDADLIVGSFNTFTNMTTVMNAATAANAVAVNNSWGFTNTPLTQSNFNAILGSGYGQQYYQSVKNYAQNGVVVFAASNTYSDTNASIMAALPAMDASLQSGWITVINGDATMNGDDVVSATRISAACLEAAAWCIAAEGTWSAARATGNSDYAQVTGTSFAAPMVSGAMALLAEAFPTLTPHELRVRLLATADNDFEGFNATGTVQLTDSFAKEVSSEWGHGFLDVKAALMPIGEPTVTLSDGSAVTLQAPLVVEGSASGDAVANAMAAIQVLATDDFSGKFTTTGENLVAQRTMTPISGEMTQAWLGDLACCKTSSYFEGTSEYGVQSDGMFAQFMMPQSGGYGFILGQTLEGESASLSLSMGVGQDQGSLLPSWMTSDATTLVTSEVQLSAALSKTATLEMTAGFGTALEGGEMAKSNGILLNSASAKMSQANTFSQGDSLSFTLGLPVAIASGRTSLPLPVVNSAGGVSYNALNIDLAPKRREIWMGAEYETPMGEQSTLFFSVAHKENAGNVAGLRDTGVLLGLRSSF